MEASKLITEWKDEYGITDRIEWDGYDDLGSKTLGITRYPDGIPSIQLHINLINHPIWAKSVLWHEFAHAAAYYANDRKGQGHNENWKGWLWKKPILALINCFAPEPGLLV